MFENSLKELQTNYIDYLLLHSVGGGEDGMEMLRKRYYDNGILDFLLRKREEGVIRNLGFSYHGDVKVFDYLFILIDKRGDEILPKTTATWHNKVFRHMINATAGDEIEIKARWKKHEPVVVE